MKNNLFCHKGMKKKNQLDLIYSDFLDMRVGTYIFYLPNKSVLHFDKKGVFFRELTEYELVEMMLNSFNICNYTFNDKHTQSIRLAKKFIKSLSTLNFSDIKKSTQSKK